MTFFQKNSDDLGKVEVKNQLPTSGRGWTAEKVAQLLTDGKAKLAPFNHAYKRILVQRPPVDVSAIRDPLNRCFAEGAPEFSSPGLVPFTVADQAERMVANLQQSAVMR